MQGTRRKNISKREGRSPAACQGSRRFRRACRRPRAFCRRFRPAPAYSECTLRCPCRSSCNRRPYRFLTVMRYCRFALLSLTLSLDHSCGNWRDESRQERAGTAVGTLISALFLLLTFELTLIFREHLNTFKTSTGIRAGSHFPWVAAQ